MQKKTLVFLILVIALLSASFVSADLASSQLCIAAGKGPACLSDALEIQPPIPVAEDASDQIGTSDDTQKIAGADFNFLSNLYQGKIYTKEELIAFGKAISERDDVKQAISNAEKSCKTTITSAACSNWMTSAYCSNYMKNLDQGRLSDCDYVQVATAGKAAYEASLTPVNPEGSIETQRCKAGEAFDGSKCDSSPPDVVLNDGSAPKESALNAAIEATAKDQQNKEPKESALAAAIEATSADKISKEFTQDEIALGDMMLDGGATSTVKELVDWQPISDRTLAYAKMKLLQEQTMCVQLTGSHCETAKAYLSTVEKLTQAKAEQAKKDSGRLITVRDRFGKIVLQFRLMIQRLFGNKLKGSTYTPAS